MEKYCDSSSVLGKFLVELIFTEDKELKKLEGLLGEYFELINWKMISMVLLQC